MEKKKIGNPSRPRPRFSLAFFARLPWDPFACLCAISGRIRMASDASPAEHTPLSCADTLATAPAFEVVVRVRAVKAMGRKLAWCSGSVADVEWCGMALAPRGEQVDVLIAEALLDCTLREFTQKSKRDLGAGRGGTQLLRFACERRDAESRNRRGAVVLYAVRYLSAARAGSSSDEDAASDACSHHLDAKDARHGVFAQFVLEALGAATLCAGTGVVDVAAGAGQLSAELCKRSPAAQQPRCTLVEPSVRQGQIAPPGSALLGECFDAEFAVRHAALLRDCSVLVGMHPDQASEAIVDVAIALGKPFALVREVSPHISAISPHISPYLRARCHAACTQACSRSARCAPGSRCVRTAGWCSICARSTRRSRRPGCHSRGATGCCSGAARDRLGRTSASHARDSATRRCLQSQCKQIFFCFQLMSCHSCAKS